MNQPQFLVRIGALFAAFVMTAALFGSQLGLAEFYVAQADAVQMAQQAAQAARVAQGTACPIERDPRS